jgi:putative transcriptional regulator
MPNSLLIRSELRKYRQDASYTQEALAQLVGVSRYTITYLENGEYLPSLELAYKLSDVFSCSVEDLFPRR